VAIPANPDTPAVINEMLASYGLGWFVGGYKGQRLLSHGGSAFGYTSDIAFLPDADLGIVVLTNESQTGMGWYFSMAVEARLLELLFDQPAEIDPLLPDLVGGAAAEAAQVKAQLGPVEPAAAPYLGR
jgi:hypothetical protein